MLSVSGLLKWQEGNYIIYARAVNATKETISLYSNHVGQCKVTKMDKDGLVEAMHEVPLNPVEAIHLYNTLLKSA